LFEVVLLFHADKLRFGFDLFFQLGFPLSNLRLVILPSQRGSSKNT
jgi:hypothetical protein